MKEGRKEGRREGGKEGRKEGRREEGKQKYNSNAEVVQSRRCSSAAKMGSVRDYNLSPLSRREGRKKTKVFHCKEGHQLIPCCHTGVTLCHSLQRKTFVFFPSLLPAQGGQAVIHHRSHFCP